MAKRIEVIYEHGALNPVEPIALPEGARLEIILLSPAKHERGMTPVEILGEIALLPEQVPEDAFSGRDHDQILYPTKTSRQ
jgi:predicted DNA-binding antitoxin AbrB/MazE fold protein